MFFHKAQNDGSVPLKYKRGKTTKTEYKSKCLGYRFRIPKDFAEGNARTLLCSTSRMVQNSMQNFIKITPRIICYSLPLSMRRIRNLVSMI